jgi:hypothetical protein
MLNTAQIRFQFRPVIGIDLNGGFANRQERGAIGVHRRGGKFVGLWRSRGLGLLMGVKILLDGNHSGVYLSGIGA